MQQKPKTRLLFIAEAVTLAHFARPFELSNQLSAQNYDIHFACDRRCQVFFQQTSHTIHILDSIPPEQFKRALEQGSPLYDYATLKAYVEADLALIEQIRPDLIIGDFRLSLAVSGRLAKIPYAAISNAYWSPYAPEQYPVPCITMTRILGLKLGSWLFKHAAPIAFKLHALPMRRLRQHYGLPAQPLDLRRVYTDADYTLYADLPFLFPLNDLPEQHFFIGPVLWSPPIAEPDWWQTLPVDKPIAYVSMGSSGSHQSLKTILRALADKAVTVIASAAGASIQSRPYSNVYIAPYLDGNAAAKQADVVICNGGSLTCQQAFAHGKPVLGIASNMDQFLNMAGIMNAHAGLVLRSDGLTETAFIDAYHNLSDDPAFSEHAIFLQLEVQKALKQKKFENFISTFSR